MMSPEQHPSPTTLKNSDPLPDRSKTLNPYAGATSFTIALIPCTAFLHDLGGTAMLATFTFGLMVSYILDSLNFKPAAFFDGFDDFWGFDGFYSLFDQWVKGEFDDGALLGLYFLHIGIFFDKIHFTWVDQSWV